MLRVAAEPEPAVRPRRLRRTRAVRDADLVLLGTPVDVYDEHIWDVYAFFGYRIGSREETRRADSSIRMASSIRLFRTRSSARSQ